MQAVCTTCSHIVDSPCAEWIGCVSWHKRSLKVYTDVRQQLLYQKSKSERQFNGQFGRAHQGRKPALQQYFTDSNREVNNLLLHLQVFRSSPCTTRRHPQCSCFDLMSSCQPTKLVTLPFPWLFNHWLKTFALGRNNWLPLTAGNSFVAPGHEHENQL